MNKKSSQTNEVAKMDKKGGVSKTKKGKRGFKKVLRVPLGFLEIEMSLCRVERNND